MRAAVSKTFPRYSKTNTSEFLGNPDVSGVLVINDKCFLCNGYKHTCPIPNIGCSQHRHNATFSIRKSVFFRTEMTENVS